MENDLEDEATAELDCERFVARARISAVRFALADAVPEEVATGAELTLEKPDARRAAGTGAEEEGGPRGLEEGTPSDGAATSARRSNQTDGHLWCVLVVRQPAKHGALRRRGPAGRRELELDNVRADKGVGGLRSVELDLVMRKTVPEEFDSRLGLVQDSAVCFVCVGERKSQVSSSSQ
jgi:hypothetical protein